MFEGLDMNALLEQAQKMQADLMQAQEDLANSEFHGSAGGEMVKVTISGSGDIKELVLAPEAVDPEDTETLAALVIAAFRDAKGKADEAAQANIPQMPQMPGLGF